MILTMIIPLEQSIIGWEGKDIVANSSEIVYEGKLKVRDHNHSHDDQNRNQHELFNQKIIITLTMIKNEHFNHKSDQNADVGDGLT